MHKHLPSSVNYREDINGLRAWAVIAVLLFHFKLIGLPGGFAGVDIFFVISGYLMTSIIVGGYEKESFSIWKFYMSRIRRIMPALMVLIATLLILGWFWLPTADYQPLGTQSSYAMTFLSNILFWKSAGYFDSAAEEKWLLHTWSLAVEAQFYILYPIFITLIWKFWKCLKAINLGIVFLFLSSLIINLYASSRVPGASFYLLPTRGWELGAGALVYLAIKNNLFSNTLKSIGFWIGWILIIGSFFLLSKDLVWPGYWAIFPVFGASLVMLANSEKSFFTNNFIAQWIGDRSYSLYLWHWPLVVALYFAGLQSEWSWVIGAFALSVVLAHLSYHFVETPTRKYLTQASLKKEIVVIFGVAVLIGIAAVSVKTFELKDRAINLSPQALYVASYSTEKKREEIHKEYLLNCDFYYSKKYNGTKIIDQSCVSTSPGGIFLWGDSHAQALSFGIRNYLNDNSSNITFSQVASSGCRPHLTEDSYLKAEFKDTCNRSNEFAIEEIKKVKPELVIMAQSNHHDENNLLQIAEALLKLGVKNVLIVGPDPHYTMDLPRIIARDYWKFPPGEIKDKRFQFNLVEIDKKLKHSVLELNNKRIQFVSILDGLCSSDGQCVAILDKEHTPLSFDYGHFTKEGSLYVGQNIIAPKIEEIFKNEKFSK